jgi:hypothetical protein
MLAQATTRPGHYSTDWICPPYDFDYIEAQNIHISCSIETVEYCYQIGDCQILKQYCLIVFLVFYFGHRGNRISVVNPYPANVENRVSS